MAEKLWTVSQLARRWSVRPGTVLHYITTKRLRSTQRVPGDLHVITDADMTHFEREIRPTLTPGPKPKQREGG